jgi:hypothetical protein
MCIHSHKHNTPSPFRINLFITNCSYTHLQYKIYIIRSFYLSVSPLYIFIHSTDLSNNLLLLYQTISTNGAVVLCSSCAVFSSYLQISLVVRSWRENNLKTKLFCWHETYRMTRWGISVPVILVVFEEVSVPRDIVAFGMFVVRGQLRRSLIIETRRLSLRHQLVIGVCKQDVQNKPHLRF